MLKSEKIQKTISIQMTLKKWLREWVTERLFLLRYHGEALKYVLEFFVHRLFMRFCVCMQSPHGKGQTSKSQEGFCPAKMWLISMTIRGPLATENDVSVMLLVKHIKMWIVKCLQTYRLKTCKKNRVCRIQFYVTSIIIFLDVLLYFD